MNATQDFDLPTTCLHASPRTDGAALERDFYKQFKANFGRVHERHKRAYCGKTAACIICAAFFELGMGRIQKLAENLSVTESIGMRGTMDNIYVLVSSSTD